MVEICEYARWRADSRSLPIPVTVITRPPLEMSDPSRSAVPAWKTIVESTGAGEVMGSANDWRLRISL
jgi:hypothetical protein